MGTLENVTATGPAAKKMKKHGRYGDSEMAHVTPGEVVLPHSAQTPEVMASLQNRFNEIGVPLERYVVRSSKNENNPNTGKNEFFLKKLVGAAAPIVGGAIGGPAGAAIGGAIGGAISGGGEAGSVGGAPGAVAQGSNLVQPVQALADDAAEIGGLAQVTPFNVSAAGESEQPLLAQSSAPVAAGPSASIAPMLSNVGVRPVGGVNPLTGQPEYYDENPRKSSMNPYTNSQEFYGWTNNAQNVNDWAVANWNNFTPEQQTQIVQVLKTIPTQVGEGRRSEALQADPNLNNQIANQLRSQGFQVGSGGNVYAPPPTAPNAPAPANNDTTPAYINPNADQGAANTPASSEEVITGIYTNTGFHGGNNRVTTASGKILEVVQNPATGELTYNAANDLNGYKSLDAGGRTQKHNPYPTNSYMYGNNSTGYNTIKIGGKASYTNPDAEKESAAGDTLSTGNGKQYGNGGVTPDKQNDYSNVDTYKPVEGTQPEPKDAYGDYNDQFADQQSQFSDWMKSMEDRLSNFTSQNEDSGTGGGAEPATGGGGGADTTVLGNVSGLTPDRQPRFRSGRGVGGRAAGF